MKCYYDILEVSRDADDNEIKTAYRKLALKWHPDKNIDNTEIAKEQFQLVQQAYEVLSDKHERAWYDKHREQILHHARSTSDDFKDDSLDVFPYFTTQCFKGYGNDEKGFYAVYRNVFDTVAKEDMEYMDSKSDYDDIPSFGDSTSDYEEIVGPFYAYWMSYTTRKSYAWLDLYNINEVKERRIFKLMEKENKKVRQKAKKERSDEIRNLVAFVRRRDKRVQAYAKILEAKNIENRQKQEQLRKQKIIQRNKEISDTKSQAEWSKFDNVQLELKEIEKKLAEQFGENLSNSETESVEENDLYCVACNKIFKNPKAFANHESSKKHKENVEKMKILMLEDEEMSEESLADEEIELENIDEANNLEEYIDSEVSESPETVEELASQSSKKKNKKKKVIRIMDDYTHDDTELHKNELETLDKNVSDNFDFGSNKKQKKKSMKKQSAQENNHTSDKTNEGTKNTEKSKPVNVKPAKTKNDNRNKNKITPDDIDNIDTSHCCVTCKCTFNSKNKLFEHLKKTGHSVMIPTTQKVPKSKKKQIK